MLEFRAYASGSRGNVYTVADGRSTVLIEMGLPIKRLRQALGFGLSEISFALLSHAHQDHSKAAADVMKAGVDLYTAAGTIEALGLRGHRIHEIKAYERFSVGGWKIMPVPVEHDAPDPLAFVVANPAGERLLFATDTYYLRNRFAGLNLIAVECNYIDDILQANIDSGLVPVPMRNRLLQSHFSLKNVKRFLRANDLSGASAIYLLHLSGDNSSAERMRREVQEVTGKPVIVCEEGH